MKREILRDATSLALTKVDVAVEANRVSYKDLDIGLGAESAIKVILILPILFVVMHVWIFAHCTPIQLKFVHFILLFVLIIVRIADMAQPFKDYKAHLHIIFCSTCHQALQSKPGSRVGELSVLTFRKECMQALVKMVQKVQEKSPLKLPVVRAIGCLDPTNMHRDAEWCLTKMKTVVRAMLQDKQLPGGISAGRENIVRGLVR